MMVGEKSNVREKGADTCEPVAGDLLVGQVE